jgi:hypothetical protein
LTAIRKLPRSSPLWAGGFTLNDHVCIDPQESRAAIFCVLSLRLPAAGRQRVGLPLASYLRLTGKRRLELPGSEVIEGAEAAAELVGA